MIQFHGYFPDPVAFRYFRIYIVIKFGVMTHV